MFGVVTPFRGSHRNIRVSISVKDLVCKFIGHFYVRNTKCKHLCHLFVVPCVCVEWSVFVVEYINANDFVIFTPQWYLVVDSLWPTME